MDAQKLFEKAERLRGLERLDEAIEKYREVLKEGDDLLKAKSLHMTGLIYCQKKEFEQATICLNKAESFFEKLQDDFMKAAVLRDKAAISFAKEHLEDAELFLQPSIKLLSGGKLRGHLGISQVKLGEVLQKRGKLAEAEDQIMEGIGNIKNSDDQFFESSAYYSLAKLQIEKDQLEKASVSAERSLELLEKIVSSIYHPERKDKIRRFIREI